MQKTSLKHKMMLNVATVLVALGSASVLGATLAHNVSAASYQSVEKYNVFKRARVNNNTYGVRIGSGKNNNSAISADQVRNYSLKNYSAGAVNVNGTKFKTRMFLPNQPATSYTSDGNGAVSNFKMNAPASKDGAWIPVSYTYVGGSLYVYYENYTKSNPDGDDHGFLAKYSKNVVNYTKKNPKFLQLATYWADRFNSYNNQSGYIKYYNDSDVKAKGYGTSASTAVKQYANYLKSGDIKIGLTGGNGSLLGHGGSLTNHAGKLYLINDPLHGSQAGSQTLEQFNTNNLKSPEKKYNLNFQDKWSGKTAPVELHNLAFDKAGNFYSVMSYTGKAGYWSGYGLFKGQLAGNRAKLSVMPLHINSVGGIQGIAYNQSSDMLSIIGNSASASLKLASFNSYNSKVKANKNQNGFVSNSAAISSSMLYSNLNTGNRETEGSYSNGTNQSYLILGPAEIVSTKVSTYYVKYVNQSGKAIKNHPMIVRQTSPNAKVNVSAPNVKGYSYTKNVAATVKIDKTGKVITLKYRKGNAKAIKRVTKSKKAAVTVKFENSKGRQIAKVLKKSGKVNAKYSTKAKKIKGYKLSKKSKNYKGKYTKKTKTVIYTYRKA